MYVTHRQDASSGKNVLQRVSYWSDGCAAQFKLKKQIYFISEPTVEVPVPNDDGGFETVRLELHMSHYFFASCHGKGPSDAETAVMKRLGRDLELRGVYMADSIDYYNAIQKFAEALTAPKDAKSDRRHTLHSRRLIFVPQLTAHRITLIISGLVGEVKKNHAFVGTASPGQVFVRWLACACDSCMKDGGCSDNCTRTEYNGTRTTHDIGDPRRGADTKESDDRLKKRATRFGKKIGKGDVVAVFTGEPSAEDASPFDLALLAEEPRKLMNHDVINGKRVTRNGKNKDMMVFDCYRYIRREESTPDGRFRTVYEQPSTTLCDKYPCTESHWHRETLELMTVRPPMVCASAKVGKKKSGFRKLPDKVSPSRSKRRSRGGGGGAAREDESTASRYELAAGIAQKICATIVEDRAYLLRTRKTVFHKK